MIVQNLYTVAIRIARQTIITVSLDFKATLQICDTLELRQFSDLKVATAALTTVATPQPRF